MALKDITEKIISEAEIKAENIRAEGRAQAVEIEKQAQAELLEQDTEQKRRLVAQIDELNTQKRVMTSMSSRNQALNQKREILAEVMKETQIQLDKISEKDYVAFVDRILTQAEKNGTVGEVMGAKGREKETKMAMANHKGFGLAKGVGKFSGGVVIKTPEGATIDMTTENLVTQVYSDEIELYTAKHLFD